jgi:hypothetical protein
MKEDAIIGVFSSIDAMCHSSLSLSFAFPFLRGCLWFCVYRRSRLLRLPQRHSGSAFFFVCVYVCDVSTQIGSRSLQQVGRVGGARGSYSLSVWVTLLPFTALTQTVRSRISRMYRRTFVLSVSPVAFVDVKLHDSHKQEKKNRERERDQDRKEEKSDAPSLLPARIALHNTPLLVVGYTH